MRYICPKCHVVSERKKEALGTVMLMCGHVHFKQELVEVTEEMELSETGQEVLALAKAEEIIPVVETGMTVIPNEPLALAPVEFSEQPLKEEAPEEDLSNYKLPRPTLYPFQEEGISFVTKALNPDGLIRALIADEMGLGKTVQALLAVKKVIEETKDGAPILVVATASIKLNWFREALRWLGIMFTPQVIEKSKDVLIPGYQVYIVTYDILRRFTKKVPKTVNGIHNSFTVTERENPFYTFPFKTIILDEAHKIKNSGSTRAAEVEMICRGEKNIIALSGTPIKNHAGEFAQLMVILRPDIFHNVEYFERKHVQQWDSYGGVRKGGLKDPKYFKQLTDGFIIRRERADVMSQLPRVRRTFYNVDFDDPKIRASYDAEENELVRQIEKDTKDKAVGANILAIISRMRHIVGVTKITAIAELVNEFLLENDRPLVVFAHHEDVLNTLTMMCKIWCYKAEVISEPSQEPRLFHSGLNAQQREELIDDFRAGKFRVLIASTLAASEGINMQFCADCIIAERQWNPANEEQAEGRFIRIGSDETMKKFGMTSVNAIYPTVINTIDEWFCELVERKRAIFSSAVNNRELTWEEKSLMTELLNVLSQKRRNKPFKGF